VNSPRQKQIKEDRAWELAISPAKSLPMQAFMLYMSGGGVQIFSMGIVFMLLLSPFKNIAAMNNGTFFVFHSAVPSTFARGNVADAFPAYSCYVRLTFHVAFAPFAPLESKAPKSFTTLVLQKLVYVACNMLTLGVGLWKCRSMGLLPTGTGDWLAFEQRGQVCGHGSLSTRFYSHLFCSRPNYRYSELDNLNIVEWILYSSPPLRHASFNKRMWTQLALP